MARLEQVAPARLNGEATTAGGTFIYEFGIFPLTVGRAEVRQFASVEDYFDFDLTSAELRPGRSLRG
jgi:hypothetical protein